MARTQATRVRSSPAVKVPNGLAFSEFRGGQIESAVVFGLSAALLEELTVKGGAIQQSNFYDYPVIRMSDVTEIHTRIVASDNPPTGVDEIGVVTVAPAIANGIYQLTGKRLRHLPMFA